MIKILYLRAPSDLQRGQVEIKYCLPCTVFLICKRRCERKRHLPSTGALGGGYGQGQSAAVLWPSKGGILLLPKLQLPPPSPCGVPPSLCSIFILGTKPFLSGIAQGGEIIRCILSLPIPCCGFFFLGSYIVVNLFALKVVSMTSERSCCIILFRLPRMRGYCFLLEKCNQHSAWKPSHYVFDPLPWSLTHISFKHVHK